MYHSINKPEARFNFAKFLKPEYGVFYSGWSTYLLSKILAVDVSFKNSELYKNELEEKCDIIANTFDQSSLAFLESHPMKAWPADNFIAIAALSNYDKIYQPKYQRTIKNWIDKIKENTDDELGMIAHQTNYENAEVIEKSRGSSMSLMLRMLAEIDPEFGKKQYQLFKKYFVETTITFPSISEYPKGEFGLGDIDSGPVILGVGFAGTIVGIGTYAVYGDIELSIQQYQTINTFGFVSKGDNKKMYLGGRLPMADAFIAWGRASALNANQNWETNYLWNWKFHFYSLIILLIVWGYHFRKYFKSFK